MSMANATCAAGFKNWTKTAKPVLRDKHAGEPYETASDSHALVTANGKLRMLYSGDQDDRISIKLARGRTWKNWSPGPTLVGPDQGQRPSRSKETSFYRRADDGKHQIFFVGYGNGNTYRSQIYLAEADSLAGPYKMKRKPVIRRGTLAGKPVHTITSPGIVSHRGKLYMTFVAWDDFQNVSQVWTMGAVSTDDGRSWTNIREVPVPVAMEGQVTKTPAGKFLAVRSGEHQGGEAIFLACADRPFGPYTELRKPILTPAGPPWEVDEFTAPQITFDPSTGRAYLFYTASRENKGWWIMRAVHAP